MSYRSPTSRFTQLLERSVGVVEVSIATFLVLVLAIGVVNLVATFVRAVLAVE